MKIADCSILSGRSSLCGKQILARFVLPWLVCALAATTVSMAQEAAQTSTESVLHSFTGLQDGANPLGDLLEDAQGNLYGTTGEGGDPVCKCGTVFRLDTSGKVSVLHVFTGSPDGAEPRGSLIEDAQGNLYGTTFSGGAHGFGTVFKLDTSGTETVLYSFTGGAGGLGPNGGLVRDTQGNLYGTTFSGGDPVCQCGTVFKLDTTGKETVLHSFTGSVDGSDGIDPAAGLVQDTQGNLYGTTSFGGVLNEGMLFKVDSSGNYTQLNSVYGNGQSPSAALTLDGQGNLYGTTVYGAPFSGVGTVFKQQMNTGGPYTVLYTFTGGADGSQPVADVVRDSQGNLYGTTSLGGAHGFGTVFKLDASGAETVLYSFTGGTDGSQPFGGLVQGRRGNLYGTTRFGGANGAGTVFRLTPRRR
jgi:uncharacterized repeat protein (TIGR03803 family)